MNENKSEIDFGPGIISTYKGKRFNVLAPNPELICVEDIAHALSNLCRFGGHIQQFYSVAQHSLIVSALVPRNHKLAALLHDASEAYLVDIPTPVKVLLPDYFTIEYRVTEAISKKFGFQYPFHESVIRADKKILRWEWNKIVKREHTVYSLMSPDEAEREFLTHFHAVTEYEEF